MNSQYTVRNLRGGFAPDNNVVIRTHSRSVATSWRHYSVTVKCLDRARYGLATMERRAASAVQYALIGQDKYL